MVQVPTVFKEIVAPLTTSHTAVVLEVYVTVRPVAVAPAAAA